MQPTRRSNKKRSSKLLRCFPHCCPDHVPRSYCGSSLHVLVTFESADEAVEASENEDVAVCARFEAAAVVSVSGAGEVVTAMPTGAIVALSERALQTSGSGTLENDWVHAEKAGEMYQRQFPANTILYVLNNHRNPQWYYSYESGSTKAQREMRHVLAAYVFLLDPISSRRGAARVASVVDRHASPSFTMMSYRRHIDRRAEWKGGANSAEEARGGVDADWLDEVPRLSVAVTRHEVDAVESEPVQCGFVSREEVGFEAQTNALQERTGADINGNFLQVESKAPEEPKAPAWVPAPASIHPVHQSAEPEPKSLAPAPPPVLPSPRPTFCCFICGGSLALSSHVLHHDTMEKLQPLLLLRLFMDFVPLDAFAFYFAPMDFRIQRRWLAKIPPSSRPQSLDVVEDAAAYTLVADVASAFSLKYFLAGPLQSETSVVADPAREQAVLRSCADLLLDVFTSRRVHQILMFSIVIPTSHGEMDVEAMTTASIESCEQFSQLVSNLYEELTQLVAARYIDTKKFEGRTAASSAGGHVSLLALVDDVLSLVYAEPKYRLLRQDASAMLLRRGNTLTMAVQDLVRAFVTQQQQLHPARKTPQSYGNRDGVDREERFPDISLGAGRRNFESAPLDNTSGVSHHILVMENRFHQQQRNGQGSWNRRWFLVPTSVFISPLQSKTDGFEVRSSLLFVVTFLRLFASLDMFVKDCQVVLKAATVEKSTLQQPNVSGTVLQLDGQTHPFTSLPNGLSTAAGAALFGDCWGLGEYEGRVANDGASLDITLMGLPSLTTSTHLPLSATGKTLDMEITYRVRVRVVLDKVDQGGEDCLSVFSEVSSAQSPVAHGNGRLGLQPTVSQFITSEGRPLLEVNSTYVGVAAS